MNGSKDMFILDLQICRFRYADLEYFWSSFCIWATQSLVILLHYDLFTS